MPWTIYLIVFLQEKCLHLDTRHQGLLMCNMLIETLQSGLILSRHALLYPYIVYLTRNYLCEPFTNSHTIQIHSDPFFEFPQSSLSDFSKQCHVLFLSVMTSYSEDVLNLIAVGLLDYGRVLLFFSNYFALKCPRRFFCQRHNAFKKEF